MRSFLIFLVLMAAQLPTTSRAQTSIVWGTILSCDNMALQVKIDPLERRRVQIVITGNIIYYLTGYPQNPDPLFYFGGPNRLYPLTAYTEGWVPNGIFSRSDFHGVVIPPGSRASAQVPGLRFFLNSNGGASLNVVSITGQVLTNWNFRSCSWNF